MKQNKMMPTFRPKVGAYITIDDEILNDVDYIKSVVSKMKNDFKESKGKYFFNYIVQIGHLNDDFIQNRSTIVLTANYYKKPRFIK